jgi:hypothetical protein
VVALGILIGLITVLIETIMTKCKRAMRIAQFDHWFDRNNQNGDGYGDESYRGHTAPRGRSGEVDMISQTK